MYSRSSGVRVSEVVRDLHDSCFQIAAVMGEPDPSKHLSVLVESLLVAQPPKQPCCRNLQAKPGSDNTEG